jgi:hypothetical protein
MSVSVDIAGVLSRQKAYIYEANRPVGVYKSYGPSALIVYDAASWAYTPQSVYPICLTHSGGHTTAKLTKRHRDTDVAECDQAQSPQHIDRSAVYETAGEVLRES